MGRIKASTKGWVKKKVSYLKSEGMKQGQAIAVALEEARRYKLLKNSGEIQALRDELEDATEVAEGFHGRGSREAFEVEEEEQFRGELAQLGELVELEVSNENLDELLVLSFDRDSAKSVVRLAGSGDRTQLFLVGGDQEITSKTLKACSPAGWQKDKVSLGNVYSISYFADKHHLTGPKQQKKGTEYGHCFGEISFENPNSREDGLMEDNVWALQEKREAGLLPELVYDRLNQRLELVGGGYEIRDEGIWD